MSHTHKAEKRGSMLTSFVAVFVGALVATLAFGLLSLWVNEREEPLRSAEITAPLPDLDLPPGSLPEIQQPAAQ